MKKISVFYLLTVVLFLIPVSTQSQTSGFGIGLMLGEPTGFSAKGWVSSASAIDGGAAWSFRHRGSLHIHADYLWHFSDVIESKERFSPYLGLGGRLAIGLGEGALGIRLPLGIVWWPRNVPLDVFLEFAPIVNIMPATDLSVNGAVGVRYFFQ